MEAIHRLKAHHRSKDEQYHKLRIEKEQLDIESEKRIALNKSKEVKIKEFFEEIKKLRRENEKIQGEN